MNEQRDEDGSKARGATAQGGAGHDLGSGCRLANDPRRRYIRTWAMGLVTAADGTATQPPTELGVVLVEGPGRDDVRDATRTRQAGERGSSGADVVGGGERWWEVSSASLDVSRRRDAKFLGSNPSAAVRRRWMCGAFIMRGVRLRGRRCQRMWCVRREPGFRACSSASGSAPRYASPGSQKSRAETYLREVVGGKARPVASFDARESLEERHDVGRIWHWPNATSLDAFGSRWTCFTGWGDTGDVVGGVRRSSTSLDARGTW
ncbi:hypothetical protein DFP72DRAFT_852098 [Ephemerocybe angulata]|uniref:Uncharacterized protein n=1 Tax=Ephemerocybe angulata TaxID=980116 RepID=A0A8H6M342_9AGAR|nr:hypothetical protein DFP72DRAFT_852098 [Tulosesus angulatus]